MGIISKEEDISLFKVRCHNDEEVAQNVFKRDSWLKYTKVESAFFDRYDITNMQTIKNS